MRALITDLYELTMAAGYFEAGKTQERATFELFVRKVPENRPFLIAAGLEQAVDYLLQLRFEEEEIAYLRRSAPLRGVPEAFWDYLRGFRFSGDVFAMPEGTPFFAGEPVLVVRAPLIEAQIPETYLLATIAFQSMVASKAVRVVECAAGRAVIEFGTRRAHSPEAGVLAGRAAYIAGCAGTSNVEAGYRFGIPIYGTAAHSWVQAFPSERKSFEALQSLLGEGTVYLIDTYDTIEGARQAAALGRPLWGVRLDSGDVVGLSREARKILDAAGLKDAKIMVSGDLNEQKVCEIVRAGAPVDAFGVGTELATSADAPNLAAVYKLAEIDVLGIKRYTWKFSPEKTTLPGAKQVFRFADRDQIGCHWECPGPNSEALLKPVMIGGRLVQELPGASRSRDYCAQAVRRLALPRPVRFSEDLLALAERARVKFDSAQERSS
ncbi:MAG: nicotinate phosphoribosyltransferase [Acidobacteria bacterium]|nr:nicotinate phosphoribosyltransferase [Acidobacteriota bacterium]MBI3280283.1 nicotinate phosphoribosyltransferase [Acidobacteriota bacterium]